MNRNILGLIAAFLLVIGGITAASGPAGGSTAGFAGGCVRVGLVLGALWLALPQIQATLVRLPGWLMSWFGGKSKPPVPPGTRTPAPPVRRPRRRSNS